MDGCQHQWKMSNIKYGFVAFDKCYHCGMLKTFFTESGSLSFDDEYRQGDHYFNRVENAQSFQFDLTCNLCGQTIPFRDLVGLFQCTSCMADCKVEILQKELAQEKTWLMVAFGLLPDSIKKPMPQEKLDVLTEYFNQRRDTSRSRMKIVDFNLIKDLSRCHGIFLLDIGLLSKEPPAEERPSVF
jgi:hypothetical protein